MEVDQDLKNKIVALTIVLSDKFLNNQDMSELWGEYKMVKFFKYVEEQGEEQGERKLFKKLVKGNFEGSDEAIFELIDKVNISKIEELSQKISKIKDLEELKEALRE